MYYLLTLNPIKQTYARTHMYTNQLVMQGVNEVVKVGQGDVVGVWALKGTPAQHQASRLQLQQLQGDRTHVTPHHLAQLCGPGKGKQKGVSLSLECPVLTLCPS